MGTENLTKKSWQNNSHWLDAISSPWYQLIFHLEETILDATHDFYREKQLHNLLLPVTTGSISSPIGLGSDSEPVKVKINGQETYLADSMQFLLEYGCRFFENGCYYIMPTFRDEKVDTRHLQQFFHSEAEIIGSLEDVMNLVEKYVKFLIQKILKKHGTEIKEVTGTTKHLEKTLNANFVRITFDEVEKILIEEFSTEIFKYIETKPEFRNITKLGEQEILKHFAGEPVWISHFDKMAVPFYQKLDEKNPNLAKNADLLMGIGETVGCGERNETTEELEEQIRTHKVRREDYEWYIKMREKFPLKTAGFGMGIERFLLFVLNHDDIRDVQLFLRFGEGNDIV